MPKKSININDSSLFAELIKGSKYKRDKVLKEILLEKATTTLDTAATKTENFKSSTNGDLKDIPVPPNGIPSANEVENNNKAVQPPLPPLPVEKSVAVIKLTELPMPPGVFIPKDVKTPSPPKEPPPTGPSTSKKIKLTELPMPPTITGTEELSEDDEMMMVKKTKKSRMQRPKIINRRPSRGQDDENGANCEWGGRCVEAFEIMAQIGEGKLVSACIKCYIINFCVFKEHTDRCTKQES